MVHWFREAVQPRTATVALLVEDLDRNALATEASRRLGICRLPDDATWTGLLGVAALGGIGFTVSIFITRLAFEDVTLQAQATVAILLASIAAAAIAAAILLTTTTSNTQQPSTG